MTGHSLVRPELAEPLKAADSTLQRKVIRALLELVLDQVPIHTADQITHAINDEHPQSVDSELREALLLSSRKAETEYLSLVEKIEDAEENDQPVDPADERRCRSHAQVAEAFAAGFHALNPNTSEAITRVAYHARAATSPEQVSRLAATMLGIAAPSGPYLPG